jgi:hypothetical protein
MELNQAQFGAVQPTKPPSIKPLPKEVSKNYRELAQLINIQIKQKRLDALTCYPWELNCEVPHP